MTRWTCRKCRVSIKMTHVVYPVHCVCGFVDRGPWPLGDWVATILAAVRVTPATWSSWRVAGGGMTAVLVRVPPAERECGCDGRRRALNHAGNWLGNWLAKLARWPAMKVVRR